MIDDRRCSCMFHHVCVTILLLYEQYNFKKAVPCCSTDCQSAIATHEELKKHSYILSPQKQEQCHQSSLHPLLNSENTISSHSMQRPILKQLPMHLLRANISYPFAFSLYQKQEAISTSQLTCTTSKEDSRNEMKGERPWERILIGHHIFKK